MGRSRRLGRSSAARASSHSGARLLPEGPCMPRPRPSTRSEASAWECKPVSCCLVSSQGFWLARLSPVPRSLRCGSYGVTLRRQGGGLRSIAHHVQLLAVAVMSSVIFLVPLYHRPSAKCHAQQREL